LHRFDRISRHLRRRNQPLRRRPYHAKGSNALRHMDGRHKLIRWGIAMHVIIDGYFRTVGHH
ncbi:hypothetical protein L210DRAFT_872797, partial [Boletus edulis BED1]